MTTINSLMVTCPHCRGSGRLLGMSTCLTCRGSRQVLRSMICTACHGNRSVGGRMCPLCGGTGVKRWGTVHQPQPGPESPPWPRDRDRDGRPDPVDRFPNDPFRW